MKCRFTAVAGFLLFQIIIPTTALGASPVEEAMVVYGHIVRTEALIDLCRRTDVTEANSYDKIYQKYEADIARTVVRIGFLVGEHAKDAGVDEDTLLQAVDEFIQMSIQRVELISRKSVNKFIATCRALPTAIFAKTTPFEPLAKRFPDEMKAIEMRP